MKKTIAILLTLCLCIGLCACAKSDNVGGRPDGISNWDTTNGALDDGKLFKGRRMLL